MGRARTILQPKPQTGSLARVARPSRFRTRISNLPGASRLHAGRARIDCEACVPLARMDGTDMQDHPPRGWACVADDRALAGRADCIGRGRRVPATELH